MENPPTYLIGKVRQPLQAGPADLLLDGHWCGHGGPKYRVFDVVFDDNDISKVRLRTCDDERGEAPCVKLIVPAGPSFLAYDSRRHPASVYYDETGEEPILGSRHIYRCPECKAQLFQVTIGFEMPQDSGSADDISWFALAAKCIKCGHAQIAYEDETA
jgi:hypothetical protein